MRDPARGNAPVRISDVPGELLLVFWGLSPRLRLSRTSHPTSLKFSLSCLCWDSLEDASKRKIDSERAAQVLTQTLLVWHLAPCVAGAPADVSASWVRIVAG